MSLLKEFRAFINKGNVVDLAVAVVIGGAFGKIVTAVVADVVMPLANAVLPQGDWRKWEVTPLHFRIGDFIGTVLDFVIVAFVVFLVLVKLMGAANRLARRGGGDPVTKVCPECLETVPAAARRCRACTTVFTAVTLLLLTFLSAPGVARAGATMAPAVAPASSPSSAAGTPPAVAIVAPPPAPPPPPAVEWRTQAKGGLLITGGNSQTTSGTVGLVASRKEGGNKLSVEGLYTYGRSNNRVARLDSSDPTVITSVDRTQVVTTKNWLAKGRYDRFFTPNNSGFVTAQGAADPIAGKSFFGGGQLGYSRQLLKSAMHLLVAEIGYDFSHERYVQPAGKPPVDPVSIHSARAFVGETLKLSGETGANASVEALFNVNKEGKALNANTNTAGVDAFHDTRVVAKVGLTTTVRKSLGVALGFTLRYDQNPAPLPIPSGAPPNAVYGPMLAQPYADTVDTMFEANMVYTFL